MIAILGVIGTSLFAWLGLSLPGWATTVGALLVLLALGAWSAWNTASCKAMALEEKQRPRLAMFFDAKNRKCIPGDDLYKRLFRIGVRSCGLDAVKSCRGIITKIEMEGQTVFDRDNIVLPFSPNEKEAESISKTISHDVPEFLDVLFIGPGKVDEIVYVKGRPTGLPPPSILFPRATEYTLHVSVSGEGTKTIHGKFKLIIASIVSDTTFEDITGNKGRTDGE